VDSLPRFQKHAWIGGGGWVHTALSIQPASFRLVLRISFRTEKYKEPSADSTPFLGDLAGVGAPLPLRYHGMEKHGLVYLLQSGKGLSRSRSFTRGDFSKIRMNFCSGVLSAVEGDFAFRGGTSPLVEEGSSIVITVATLLCCGSAVLLGSACTVTGIKIKRRKNMTPKGRLLIILSITGILPFSLALFRY